MPRLFALTMFLSAALLFCVQPMIAKMLLPLLGGAPAVWNTCMVFFQTGLLAGYLYAHAATTWLSPRRQVLLHTLVLLLPLTVFGWTIASTGAPLGISEGLMAALPQRGNPVGWLLLALLVTVGVPFFVLSTSAPLLQKWFANTGHVSGRDPYFLYAASNFGSMLALAGYPLFLEPLLPLQQQSWSWAVGFGLLIALTLTCGAIVWSAPERTPEITAKATKEKKPAIAGPATAAVTWLRRVRWIALAFVPSSLMLGVTTYLSTDVAAIPLLWVIPLALYLLTFILVFSQKEIIPHWLMVRVLPGAALLWVVIMLLEATEPAWILIPGHLVLFFVATMVCHGELARDRPSTKHLTEFYLWMSVGGVLGGAFNALLAPLLFTRIIEYPLAVVLACLLQPPPTPKPAYRGKVEIPEPEPPLLLRPKVLDFILPVGMGLLTAGAVLGLQAIGLHFGGSSTSVQVRLGAGLMFGGPAAVCYLFSSRPLRFGLGLAAVLLASSLHPGVQGELLYINRNFFGVLRVTKDPEGNFHRLVHGNTIHGRQRWDPEPVFKPLAYYYPSGPIGNVFDEYNGRATVQPVGVVGLGAGSLAYYAKPGQTWTFYEIDPAVEAIARDERFFTFLNQGFPNADLLYIDLGDARLQLRNAPPKQFGLLVLDAFSSDAIPMHLITREALALYTSKLADNGMLAFHVSNRYLDLKPILAKLAADANPPLICYARDDLDGEITPEERAEGKQSSQWVVMAHRPEDLGNLVKPGSKWYAVQAGPDVPAWTDSFSNLLSAWK